MFIHRLVNDFAFRKQRFGELPGDCLSKFPEPTCKNIALLSMGRWSVRGSKTDVFKVSSES